MDRKPELINQDGMEGHWRKDEHQRFLYGIMEYGKDWKIVEKIVQTRVGSQVRSHAQKFFQKLQQIQKNRRKAKKKNLVQPSQIERQILQNFTEEDINHNTPQEIVQILRKNWNEVAKNFKAKRSELKQKRKSLAKKMEENLKQDLTNKTENFEVSLKAIPNFQESYFIKTIKMNEKHFRAGHLFDELMEFNQKMNVESQVQDRAKQRRVSFCLLDEEDNETKLKETLQALHQNLGIIF